MRQLPPRMQDQLYHDMILPEETLKIRQKVRDFSMRVIAPRATEIAHTEESRESFPWDVFRQMAAEDLFKIPFPAEVKASVVLVNREIACVLNDGSIWKLENRARAAHI